MSAPLVATVGANNITATSATLIGSVNTQNASGTAWFSWGLTGSYGNTTPTQTLTTSPIPQTFLATLTGLTPGTEIFFAAVGDSGSTVTAAGLTFTPTAPASAITPPTPNVSIPVLQYPITIVDSQAITAEQGSFGDVLACVQMVVNAMYGTIPELPTFGIPDPTGLPGPPSPDAILQAVQQLEPRATQEAVVTSLDMIGASWAITLSTQAIGTGQ